MVVGMVISEFRLLRNNPVTDGKIVTQANVTYIVKSKLQLSTEYTPRKLTKTLVIITKYHVAVERIMCVCVCVCLCVSSMWL